MIKCQMSKNTDKFSYIPVSRDIVNFCLKDNKVTDIVNFWLNMIKWQISKTIYKLSYIPVSGRCKWIHCKISNLILVNSVNCYVSMSINLWWHSPGDVHFCTANPNNDWSWNIWRDCKTQLYYVTVHLLHKHILDQITLSFIFHTNLHAQTHPKYTKDSLWQHPGRLTLPKKKPLCIFLPKLAAMHITFTNDKWRGHVLTEFIQQQHKLFSIFKYILKQ